jgi:hypothetical protein
MKVSYYSKIDKSGERKTHTPIEILKSISDKDYFQEPIERIRAIPDKDERMRLKEQLLPVVTWAGEFSYRRKISLIKASGLACLDFDGLEDSEAEELKKKFKGDKYTYSAFFSPSKGLKVLIRIPIVQNDDQYKIVYAQLLEHYSKFGPNPDKSNSDVSRACYLSYDPEIFLNEKCEEFPVDWGKKDTSKEEKFSDDEVKKLNKNIPTYCAGIEQIACQKKLPSGSLTRHSYLDGNVFQYATKNKKPDVLKAYKKVQGRSDSAFNGADKWGFCCATIHKYLINNPCEETKEWRKICLECPNNPKENKPIYTSLYVDDEKKILVEQIYRDGKNYFCVLKDGKLSFQNVFFADDGKIYQPIYGEEIQKGAIRLPNGLEEYENEANLDKHISEFIHKYLDVPPDIEQLGLWQIKHSWVFQKFHTLNYLRARGEPGQGKTRFLDTFGALCYKTIATSGATTAAPIFRIIDKWRGTLIMDEADLQKSDESQDIIKIINHGYERGKHIMRCDQNDAKKINFFDPFCPKIIATRKSFYDKATESRCITHIMKETNRKDIPISLTEEFFSEAQKIRNMLLLWRFHKYFEINPNKQINYDFGELEPRVKQIVNSLIILFADDETQLTKFKRFITKHQEEIIEERQNSFEGQIVGGIYKLIEEGQTNFSNKDIIDSAELKDKQGNELNPRSLSGRLTSMGFGKSIPKKIGGITKRCVVYEPEMLLKMFGRYGYEVTEVTIDTVTPRNEEDVRDDV